MILPLTIHLFVFAIYTGVCHGASVTEIDGGNVYGFGLVSLDLNRELPSVGKSWVSVSPISTFAVSGPFLLMNNGASGAVTPGGANARLTNSGEGFGLGTLPIVNLGHAYSLTVVPEPIIASWFILGDFGPVVRRKRSHFRERTA